MNKVQDATKEYLKKDIPEFDTGDTLVVSVLVREGNKERVQNFEGVVIGRRAGSTLDATFTVRKISNGVGVERIFPYHSPNLDSIKVLKRGKVRRAKLYYLRDRKGKSARIAEKIKKKIGVDVSVKEPDKIKKVDTVETKVADTKSEAKKVSDKKVTSVDQKKSTLQSSDKK